MPFTASALVPVAIIPFELDTAQDADIELKCLLETRARLKLVRLKTDYLDLSVYCEVSTEVYHRYFAVLLRRRIFVITRSPLHQVRVARSWAYLLVNAVNAKIFCFRFSF